MTLSGHTVEMYALKTKLGSLCLVWKTLLHTMGSISLLRTLRWRYKTVPPSVYSILIYSGKALVCLTWFHLQMMKGRSVLQRFFKSCWKITSFCSLVICWLFHIKFNVKPSLFPAISTSSSRSYLKRYCFFLFQKRWQTAWRVFIVSCLF